MGLPFLSAPVGATAQEIEGLQGNAAGAIEAQIRSANLRYPQVHIFYGDLTGRGTSDAVSFVYYDAGGSAERLATWIWLDADGEYELARTVPNEEVFGYEPRGVSFAPGRVTVTTTVPQANDAHCCPTGERTFVLELGANEAPENSPATAARSSGNWVATAQNSPAGVTVTGTARDGRTTFSGGCNPRMGKGFMGSLYGYGGDALQRVDDQSEPVSFKVAGRSGTSSFAGQMHYFAPDEAWVITGSLPTDFLDAFARGNTLSIQNGRGEEAVAFDLGGSSKAVQAMRQVCGM
ncbi:hypothetical protein CX676_12780 [Paracoccus zhejiangensis]|uniref:Uncharacterized protein n=2 Tax=Paracoccus zhejiangensis TaxID=1077935 RepID=A0A2H5F055_9RHOB|nr:hypothetical protein CX676_12780 [Paracoccus zhejiangensis]